MPTIEPWHAPGPLRRLAHFVILHYFRPTLRLALRAACGTRVVGQERVPPRGGLIVAANHLSFADPVVLQVYIPRFLFYLMTANLYRRPILHGLVRFWGVLPVQADATNKATLRAAEGILAAGGAIGIFPEGGISRDGLVHDAQPGIALLAQRARVPILPVGIAGTQRLLPPDTWRLRPAHLSLHIGEPILPAGEPRAALAARVTAALRSCAHLASAS